MLPFRVNVASRHADRDKFELRNTERQAVALNIDEMKITTIYHTNPSSVKFSGLLLP